MANYLGASVQKAYHVDRDQLQAPNTAMNCAVKSQSVSDMASSLNEEAGKMLGFASQLRDRLLGPSPECVEQTCSSAPDLKGYIRSTGNSIANTNAILQEIYNYLIG